MPTDGRIPEASGSATRGAPADHARLFCLLDPGWADRLLPGLRAHFARDPLVAVLVERRAPSSGWHRPEARRRAPVAERDAARALPAELREEARHLRLVQPLAPLGRTHEDADIVTLVAMTIAMEPEATSELWWRISPRVLARLELSGGQLPDAGAAGAILGRILDEAPGYDPARQPLPRWLDDVVDRLARERAADTLCTRAVAPGQPVAGAALRIPA
jgi:hypothetical protein